jgi:hypothetical protein
MDYTTLIVLALVAGYMFYVARRFWIGFGQAWHKPGRPSRTGLGLRYVFTGDRGDCDYDLLWATQMPTLEILRSAGSSGASLARMAKLYREFARTYPELCDGSNFLDWIEALQNAEVAVHCRYGAMIAITEKGLLALRDLQGIPPLGNCSSSRYGCAEVELGPST